MQNFGCRATQADGAALERQLLERGFRPAGEAGEAEVVILNTCTVTAAADQDARSAIRRIHRQNPECRILVTGCYAQRAPEELAALPGVTWVVGNSHKQEVAGIVAGTPGLSPRPQHFIPASTLGRSPDHPIADRPMVLVGDIFAHTELLAAPVFEAPGFEGPEFEGKPHSERTRPNLKVQDGCDNRCSFCVIPAVRGQSRSLRMAEVVREVRALVEAGYREVVISGINLGRWGRDLSPARKFEDLVEAILAETELERLRLSSVEPMDWTERLIGLVAGERRIAKHAHVPLQSGSDRVLRRMHRRYRPWHYAERIHKIRELMPQAAIGADVMVGFPGETDAEFEESRAFIACLPFTYLHVFTYAPRPGTPAATMPHQVRGDVARERNRVLRELAAEKNRAFRRAMVGRRIQAITLGVQDEDSTEALTDNYVKLRLKGRHEANRWANVRVDSVTADGVQGLMIAD